jgi:hypothetical protein
MAINVDEYQKLAIAQQETINRAKSIFVPTDFAKVYSLPTYEIVSGFHVLRVDYENCSATTAIATLFGEFKEYKYTVSNGIELTKFNNLRLYLNLDSNKLIPYSNSHSNPIQGEWNKVDYSYDDPLKMSTNESEILIFKRYEQSFHVLRSLEVNRQNSSLNNLQEARNKYIDDLTR